MAITPTHVLALRFEGLGKPSATTATDKRFRFATSPSPPTWDTDGLYVEAFPDGGLPREIGFGVDFRSGHSSVGGLTFALLPTQRIRNAFFRKPVLVARLIDGMDATDVGMVLDTDGLAATTLVLGREVIYIVSGGGGGGPTYSYVVQRGALGSSAQTHGTSGVTIENADGIDVECFDPDQGGAYRGPGRIVDLVRTRLDATGYTDETVLWSGVVGAIDAPTPNEIQITCNGVLDLVNGEICTQLWKGRLREELSVTDEAFQPAYNYADPTRRVPVSSSAGETLISWDGKTVVSIPTPTNGIGLINEGNIEYLSGDVSLIGWRDKPPARIWACYSTDPSAPNLGSASVRLAASLAELTLQLLMTSESGDNYDSVGGATNYDLAQDDEAASDVGLGIPWSLIDVAGIEAIEDAFGSGEGSLLYRPRIHLAVDGKPVNVKRLLQPEWHSVSCVLTAGKGGLLTVVRLSDSPTPGAITITTDDLVDKVEPRQRRRLEDVLDRVAITYDAIPGAGTRTDTFEDVFNRRRAIQPSNRFDEIHAPGLAEESLARALAIAFVGAYHEAITEIQITTHAGIDVWPGEVVKLTCSAIFDVNGDWGIVGAACLVTGRQYSTATDRVTYILLYVGALYDRTALWASSGYVASAPSSTVARLSANRYTTGTGPYATDVASFQAALDAADDAGQTVKCDILASADLATVTPGLTLASISSNDLTFSAAHGASAGDRVVLSSYDEQGSAVQALFVSMADSSDKVGSANDDGYQWTR